MNKSDNCEFDTIITHETFTIEERIYCKNCEIIDGALNTGYIWKLTLEQSYYEKTEPIKSVTDLTIIDNLQDIDFRTFPNVFKLNIAQSSIDLVDVQKCWYINELTVSTSQLSGAIGAKVFVKGTAVAFWLKSLKRITVREFGTELENYNFNKQMPKIDYADISRTCIGMDGLAGCKYLKTVVIGCDNKPATLSQVETLIINCVGLDRLGIENIIKTCPNIKTLQLTFCGIKKLVLSNLNLDALIIGEIVDASLILKNCKIGGFGITIEEK
jgi:hypothetical protein